jgi:hypothetical protein
MTKTTRERAVGRRKVLGAGAAALAILLGLGVSQATAFGQEKPTFEVGDFGVVPRPTVLMVLLEQEAVQQELKLTDAQKKDQRTVIDRLRRELQKRVRRTRDATKAGQKPEAVETKVVDEARSSIRGVFKSEQWERLGQIQLQAQGPLAFTGPVDAPFRPLTDVGAPLAERLKLSDDQAKRIKVIVDRGV